MNLFGDDNGAKFSDCGKHRLALWRIWDKNKPLVCFIGLNPSTANATSDDPTIRRVKSMAALWGYGGVYMLNLFTYISTDPKKLNIKEGNLPISDNWLFNIANKCDRIIFAYGNFEVFGRDKQVKAMFPSTGFPRVYALQVNKNGSPKQPLYVKSTIVPVRY